jgi:hypothetical protein
MNQTPAPPDPDDALAALLRDAARDPAPPADVLARAVALRDPAREIVRRAGAAARRLVAALVEELAGDAAPAFGVRSIGASPRHLLFRAERCEVDLRIDGIGTMWNVTGQIFGAPRAYRVVLRGEGVESAAQLGAICEFRFAGLAAGRYELAVEMPDLDIVIPALEVGPASAT